MFAATHEGEAEAEGEKDPEGGEGVAFVVTPATYGSLFAVVACGAKLATTGLIDDGVILVFGSAGVGSGICGLLGGWA